MSGPRSKGKRLSANQVERLTRYIACAESGTTPDDDDRAYAKSWIDSDGPKRRRGPMRRDERSVGDKGAMRALAIAATVNYTIAKQKRRSESAAFEDAAAKFHVSKDTVRREWRAHGKSVAEFFAGVKKIFANRVPKASPAELREYQRIWQEAFSDEPARDEGNRPPD